jgi:hypothetical protein
LAVVQRSGENDLPTAFSDLLMAFVCSAEDAREERLSATNLKIVKHKKDQESACETVNRCLQAIER